MPRIKLRDIELSYTVDDYTDPWKRAPWVLLHHSAVGSSRRWYGWVPHLARSYRVLRYDVRGHGDSTWPSQNGHFTLDTFVDDVRAILDALDIPRIHFVGASGGGIVGLKFAHAYPERTRSLTLVASTPSLSESQVDLSQWGELLRKHGVKGWLMADSQARFGSAPEGLVEWFTDEGARTSVKVAKAYTSYMATVDLTHLLPEIKTKTLILAAEEDEITPIHVQQLMRDTMPNARLTTYGDVGHNIKVLIPDRLAQDTLEFLQDVDKMEDLTLSFVDC